MAKGTQPFAREVFCVLGSGFAFASAGGLGIQDMMVVGHRMHSVGLMGSIFLGVYHRRKEGAHDRPFTPSQFDQGAP